MYTINFCFICFLAHIENEKIFSESLEKLGNYSMSYEADVPEIGKLMINSATHSPCDIKGFDNVY